MKPKISKWRNISNWGYFRTGCWVRYLDLETGWRKLQSEKFRNFRQYPNTIRIVKSEGAGGWDKQ